MNKLFQLISDGDGVPSTMRIAVLLIITTVMGVWAALCIKAGQFVPMDMKIVGLMLGALGAKSIQSFAEAGTSGGGPAKTLPPAPGGQSGEEPIAPGAAAARPVGGGGAAATLLFFAFCLLPFAFLGSGCRTVPAGQPAGVISQDTNGIVYIGSWQVRTNDVYNGIKVAATIGTQQGIRADANSIAYFQLVEQVLAVALASGQYDPATLQSALQTVSVNEVRDNPDVQNGVQLGLALYGAFFGQVVAQHIADAGPYLRPALAALHDGIAAGLPVHTISAQ